MTMTLNTTLAKVRVDLHSKKEGPGSNVSAVRVLPTDRQTVIRYQVHLDFTM